MAAPARFIIMTAATPGAIGIIQLHGQGATDVLRQLIGREPAVNSCVADLDGIDEGVVALMPSERRGAGGPRWQIMPHGGPRVMQRLAERLRELGAEPDEEPSSSELYPEAGSGVEADMLATLARAASPAAIDLLLAQPQRWRDAAARNDINPAAVMRTTAALDHLVTPPTVVLVGRANVGKSTLSNLVMGRAASITADLPGTTRDWVGGLAELPTEMGELAVRWFDTPGLRDSDDPLEQRAIELARSVVAAADVLIAMRDPRNDWPDEGALPRTPDLWVMNKADLESAEFRARDPALGTADQPLRISAAEGWGLDDLAAAVGRVLGVNRTDTALWAFSPGLKAVVREADWAALRQYVNPASTPGKPGG